jgi:hypothetical protein
MSENCRKEAQEKLLAGFVAYCKAHPSERFWQALRNWSEASFILHIPCSAAQSYVVSELQKPDLQLVGQYDTFHWVSRTGDRS